MSTGDCSSRRGLARFGRQDSEEVLRHREGLAGVGEFRGVSKGDGRVQHRPTMIGRACQDSEGVSRCQRGFGRCSGHRQESGVIGVR